MNQTQLDILNEIKVKMFYDPRKTLSEQSVVGAPDGGVIGTREPSKKPVEPENPIEKAFENVEIFPIPGYTTYIIPKINDANGGIAYYYFPLETTEIQKFTFPVCEDFKNGEEFCKRYSVKQPQLAKLLPAGSIRDFRIGDDYYVATIGYNLTKNQLIFAGFKNQDGDAYISPNPEDFKSEWQKFLDEYGTIYQIVGSILVVLVAEFFSAGLATPVAWRIALEILGELVVNIPVALYDYRKGNTISGNLSLLFALLPFMDIKGLQGVSKELAENISKKLAQREIKNVDDLGNFYEALPDPEKYVFYQVMKQDPSVFKKQYKEGISKLFSQAVSDKKIVQKLLLKDQTWWKNLGIQGSVVFFIMVAKEVLAREFTELEIERMAKFYLDLKKQLDDDKKRLLDEKIREDKQFATKLVTGALLPEGEKKDLFMEEMIESLDPQNEMYSKSKLEDVK
jgi:hypothetical protein